MTFLHPALLIAGIACIAIPIIIHLLMHRRRKPVMWGAMRFLLEAYRRQRRRLMLEKWLLLACRCLLLALLAFAIGRPLVGGLLGGEDGRVLIILIDNSMTSSLRADGDDGQTALDRHKREAIAAITALRESRSAGGMVAEGNRVGLVTLGGPAEGVVMPPSSDLAAITRMIDAIAPTDSRADFAGGLQLVADAMTRGTNEESSGTPSLEPARTFVALFSDFREGSLDLSPGSLAGVGADSAVGAGVRLPQGVTLLVSRPAQTSSAANVAIAAVEPLRSVVVGDSREGEGSSGADELVRVMLRRSGPDLPEATTNLRTRVVGGRDGSGATPNTEDAVRTPVRWAPGQDAAMVVASVRRPRSAAGAIGSNADADRVAAVIVASIDSDPLQGDNTWRRPIEFRDALRVGVVGQSSFVESSADRLDPAAWARLALSPTGDVGSSGIEVIDIDPGAVDAARLAGLDAVVLPRPDLVADSSWVRIGLFLSSGGVVLVTPPPGLNVHLWPDAMAKGLGLSSDWALARESRAVEGVRLIAAPPPSSGAGASADPASSTNPTAAPDLLGLVRSELDELLRPISVQRVLPLDPGVETGRILLQLEDGAGVLWAGRPGVGSAERRGEPGLLIYLGTALSLEWSDLPAKPLMVPLMQESVRQGVGQARGSWWSVAGGRPVVPGRTVELRSIADAADDDDADSRAEIARVPIDETGAAVQPLRTAGAFAAIDERGAMRGLVAVNPDIRASRIAPQPEAAVGARLLPVIGRGEEQGTGTSGEIVWLPAESEPDVPAGMTGDAAAAVQQTVASLFGAGERSSPIDLPLLIAALALAIVEVGLARWASHAEISGRAGADSGRVLERAAA